MILKLNIFKKVNVNKGFSSLKPKPKLMKKPYTLGLLQLFEKESFSEREPKNHRSKWKAIKKWIKNRKLFLWVLALVIILLLLTFYYSRLYTLAVRFYYLKIIKNADLLSFRFSNERKVLQDKFNAEINKRRRTVIRKLIYYLQNLPDAAVVRTKQEKFAFYEGNIKSLREMCSDLNWIEEQITELLSTSLSPFEFWRRARENEKLGLLMMKVRLFLPWVIIE